MINKQKEEKINNKSTTHKTLIFGVDHQGIIIHFNKGCESTTGFKKNQIIGQKISDTLLPKTFLQQWDNLLKRVINNTLLDDFIVPWIVSSGKEVLITCSLLHSESNIQNNQAKSYYFIGKILDERDTKTESIDASKMISEKHSDYNDENKALKEHMIDSFIHENNLANRTIPDDKIENLKACISNVEKKYDEISNMLSSNTKKIYEKIEEVQSRIESAIMNKDALSQDITEEIKTMIDDRYKDIISLLSSKTKNQKHHPFTLSLSKKRKIIEEELNDLEEKRKMLALYETQLKEEKEILESEKIAWKRWKEKLEQIESEIERRRQELVKEEKYFREQILSSYTSNLNIKKENVFQLEPTMPISEIPQSAFILQRGILKEVNSSFASMIGYSPEELTEKHFFDLLTPEGLAKIEQYHLNRLKGENSSSYGTIISTKDNKSIPVEISVKPTIYNGERAELAIITIKTEDIIS
ncbi:MAG: PAS domain S-box protein [Candidatus Thermoplasmatota archaeon]